VRVTALDPHEAHTSTPAELKALNAMKREEAAFIGWRDAGGALRMRQLDPTGGPITIGRSAQSSVVLGWDAKVSAVHAELTPLAGEWLIADDGLSTNGTYVGGERVASRRRLRDEDRIALGSTILVFHTGKGAKTATELDGRPIVQRDELSQTDLRVLELLCTPLVLNTSEEPAPTEVIAREVFLTEFGVKRCLTRLFKRFDIQDAPKRTRLAKRAIATGVVSRRHYEERG
jgi:hypothetical protein